MTAAAHTDAQAGLIVELRALRLALEAIEAKVMPFEVPAAAMNFLPPAMRTWVKSIIRHIAYEHGLVESELVGPLRKATITRPRSILIWVLRRSTPWSTLRIGMIVDRDHSSVLAAIRKVDRWRAEDPITGQHTDALVAHAIALREQLLAATTTKRETDHAPQS